MTQRGFPSAAPRRQTVERYTGIFTSCLAALLPCVFALNFYCMVPAKTRPKAFRPLILIRCSANSEPPRRGRLNTGLDPIDKGQAAS